MSASEIDRVLKWFEQAVLSLGLCPFAAEPWNAGRIRLAVTSADSEEQLLNALCDEILLLVDSDQEEIETTILIVANLLQDFGDYNQFLSLVDEVIERNDWAGQFQVASFHPNYQFADTEPRDIANLTNRSPFPLLHILRESSVTRAVHEHGETQNIPTANIARLESLSDQRRSEIFDFLQLD